eukprot:4657829-Amphidinium_carterae.1
MNWTWDLNWDYKDAVARAEGGGCVRIADLAVDGFGWHDETKAFPVSAVVTPTKMVDGKRISVRYSTSPADDAGTCKADSMRRQTPDKPAVPVAGKEEDASDEDLDGLEGDGLNDA